MIWCYIVVVYCVIMDKSGSPSDHTMIQEAANTFSMHFFHKVMASWILQPCVTP